MGFGGLKVRQYSSYQLIDRLVFVLQLPWCHVVSWMRRQHTISSIRTFVGRFTWKIPIAEVDMDGVCIVCFEGFSSLAKKEVPPAMMIINARLVIYFVAFFLFQTKRFWGLSTLKDEKDSEGILNHPFKQSDSCSSTFLKGRFLSISSWPFLPQTPRWGKIFPGVRVRTCSAWNVQKAG